MGTSIGVRFQVTAGGFLDIDFVVQGPDGLIVYSGDRETEGKYSFKSHASGTYSFCFGNKMSTMTSKTISAHLNVGEDEPNTLSNAATKGALSPLENSILTLSEGLTSIHEEHEYLTLREETHRQTMDSTHSRVLWWTFIEASILIGIAGWQVYSIYRVFETKRPI